ncbi:MAG: SGNH hydrolase domain-containing protein, partial [Schlesneria sp.]
DAYRNGGIIIGKQDNTNPRIVVLGDSHGSMWADAIRSVTEELEIKTSFITMNGVSPFINIPLSRNQKSLQLTSEEKYLYDKSRIELLQLWKPDVTILCVRWEYASESEANALLDILEQHSSKTLLMEQPPELAVVGNRNALQYLIFRGIKPEIDRKQFLPIGNTERVNAGRDLIRKLARTRKTVDVIPIYDIYVEDSEAFVLDARNMLYYDDDHLTTYGAKIGRKRIRQSIAEALHLDER